MSSSPSSLLIATIVFAFVSRTTGTAVGPYGPAPSVREKARKLKSAQRFTVYLAFTDILACSFLLWEVAASSADAASAAFGRSEAGAARLFVACSARPTILMVVAGLSYFNVVSGKSVRLGRWDWTVWTPPTAILSLGVGLATLAHGSNKTVWIGMLALLGVVTLAVTASFGRLLIAIARVRKATLLAARESPFAAAQGKILPSTTADPLGRSFLPPLHTNFSGLSKSFITTIGRSTHSLDLQPNSAAARDVIPFASDGAPALAYSPSSRTSLDSTYLELRPEHLRSPTPNSALGLLANARNSFRSPSPFSTRSASPSASRSASPLPPRPSSADHEVISFENMPRPSFGSYASSISHGMIGSSAMRQAVTAEVWGDSPMPGTGYSNEVDLSTKEARGAIVRIGGHLASCIIGYALLVPFLVASILSQSGSPALVPCVLLGLGVCQPGVVLAIQVALTEGVSFEPRRPPPVLTSSSALNLEQHILARQHTHRTADEDEVEEIAPSRPDTPASSVYYMAPQSRAASPMPGIPLDGGDCDEAKKGALARAWAMAAPHPKLLVLTATDANPPAHASSGSSSGFKPVSHQTHTRLRSLSLARVVLDGGGQRTGSTASRATVAGFEHEQHRQPPDPDETEHIDGPKTSSSFSSDSLTRALLAEPRRASWTGNGKKPFGFGGKSSPAPRSPTALLAQQVEHFASWSREHREQHEPEPKEVAPVPAPAPRRRSSQGAIVIRNEAERIGAMARKTKNVRNLSLPGFLPPSATVPASPPAHLPPAEEPAPSAQPAPTALTSLADLVRSFRGAPAARDPPTESEPSVSLLARKDTKWKDRTARAWDLIEARERALDISGEATLAGRRRSLADSGKPDRSVDTAEAIEMSERKSGPGLAETTFELEQSGSLEGVMIYQGSQCDESFTKGDETENLAALAATKREASEDELGVVRCASVRPLSHRTSSATHRSTGSLILLRTAVSPPHVGHHQQPSDASLNSIQLEGRSITSVGYQNMLDSRGGTWLRNAGGSSSADESAHNSSGRNRDGGSRPASQSSNASSTASSVPSPGLRPLRLLGQRDPNASRSDRESDSDREFTKAASRGKIKLVQTEAPSDSTAASCQSAPPRRTSGFFFPVPPIPDTIEEAEDEDRISSRTPTPKTARSRASTVRKGKSKKTPPSEERQGGGAIVRRPSKRNSGGIPYLPSSAVTTHARDQSVEWPATSTPPARPARRRPSPADILSSEDDSVHVTERTRARRRRGITSSQSEASEEERENRRPVAGAHPVAGLGGASPRRLFAGRDAVGSGVRGLR